MISHTDLQKIAKARFKDARFLFNKDRYDAAVYLCGYSVELILKAVICKELCLRGIPNTTQEFDNVIQTLQKIKTHNLEILLSLISDPIQQEVKSTYFSEWGSVLDWNPEMRYLPIRGEQIKPKAEKTIKASKKLLGFFNKKL